MILAFSLYVTACLAGTLHGEPQMLCHEFQIRHYAAIKACEDARAKTVDEWLAGLKPFNLDPRVIGERCGPADIEGDDI